MQKSVFYYAYIAYSLKKIYDINKKRSFRIIYTGGEINETITYP